MLQRPNFVKYMAMQGLPAPTYAYAANNPLRNTDPDGLYQRISIPGFNVTAQCNNYTAALKVALSKAGCLDGVPAACDLPCNICKNLVDGAGAPLTFGQGMSYTENGTTFGTTGAVTGFPPGTRAVEINARFCGNETGNAGSVSMLAQAMMHEALHLCREVDGNRDSRTGDRSKWLSCGGQDAEQTIDKCFATP